MPRINKKKSDDRFLKKLNEEIKNNLIRYIAGLLILIISGSVAFLWNNLNFLKINKGNFEVLINNQLGDDKFELRIYQNDYFIKNIVADKIYEINDGNYELKAKVNWNLKPILIEKFKIIKNQHLKLYIELPKRQNTIISGHVKIRKEYLENGANLIVEVVDQNRRTTTADDGAYLLEVTPDMSIKIVVKQNTKLIWRTLIVNRVKPGEEITHNITIPYEKLY